MSDENGYCVHGVYVGGCGIDWMCGDCEMGNFTPIKHTQYQVIVSGDCSAVTGKPFNHGLGWENTRKEADRVAALYQELVPDSFTRVEIKSRVITIWTNGKDD